MLTSHHSLLSGIAAVLCATGAVSSNPPKSTFQSLSKASVEQPASHKSLQKPLDYPLIQTTAVSSRGSGRIGNSPGDRDHAESNIGRVAHRGSGRVVPKSR